MEARSLIHVLVEASDKAGLRQADVALALGVGQQHVSAIYRYKAEVKGSQLFAWAQLLKLSLAEIVLRAEAEASKGATVVPIRRGLVPGTRKSDAGH